jgi:isoquinoline 1-oxidoreductase beta subunit
VSVDKGQLKVHKVTCVMHLGRVVNPHFVKGQVEGSIIWALGALLYGGIDFENGRVKQSNYHDYKVLRMDETPEIVVHLIESDDAPTGAGEPAVPPLAPAVLNAIFAATGKRIRKIPVLPEDLT